MGQPSSHALSSCIALPMPNVCHFRHSSQAFFSSIAACFLLPLVRLRRRSPVLDQRLRCSSYKSRGSSLSRSGQNKQRPLLLLLSYSILPLSPAGPLSTLRGQVGIGIINCSSGESPSRPWANLLRVKFPSAIALFNPFIRYLDHNPSRRLVRPAHASCGLAGPTRRRRSRTRPFRPPCRFRLALLG